MHSSQEYNRYYIPAYRITITLLCPLWHDQNCEQTWCFLSYTYSVYFASVLEICSLTGRVSVNGVRRWVKNYFYVLHCKWILCTTLQVNFMYYTASEFYVLHCKWILCTTLQVNSVYYTASEFYVLHCKWILCTTLQVNSMYYTASEFYVLHCKWILLGG